MKKTYYNPDSTYKYEGANILSETLRNLPVSEADEGLVQHKRNLRQPSFWRRLFNRLRGIKANKTDIRPVIRPLNLEKLRDSVWKEYNSLPMLEKFYSNLEPFAEGGQGILSSAFDTHLGRPVAVKTLKKKLLHDLKERDGFITEGKITAQLQHTGIIPIYNLCRDSSDGIHLVMKLVRGVSLFDYLKDIDSSIRDVKMQLWTISERINGRLEIFLRICDAINYAHSRGVIHCDLKPENILIGEFGAVYVMDWGIAKIVRNEKGESLADDNAGKLDGTPSFLPPEAYCGKGRDERSDIFALGLILYEIVTLNRGYSGEDMEEVMVQIKYGRRNPIRHRHGYSISREIAAIINKATEYYPDDRYQTVESLANDVRRYIIGMETSALPDGLLKSIRRSINRHKFIWLAIAFLLAMLTYALCEFPQIIQ